MIKNLPMRLNADNRGHISSGRKVLDRNGNERPSSIEGFDLSPFPELEAVYGKDPARMLITFPVNDMASVFDDEYSAWAKKGGDPVKKRVCDGEECTHRIDETFCGESFAAGEVSACLCANLPEDHKDRCKYSAVLRAMVLHPETREYLSPKIYLFRTHSPNSGGSIRTELAVAYGVTARLYGEPRLVGIPFELSVRMVSSAARANSRFPVWNLRIFELDAALLGAGNGEAKQLTNGHAALPAATGDQVADALLESIDSEPAPKAEPAPRAAAAPPTQEAQRGRPTKAQAAPAASTPANGTNKGAPVAPRAADVILAAKDKAIANAPKGEPDPATMGRMVAALDALTLGNDKRRLALLLYLFGVESRKELSRAECIWLTTWIRASKDAEGVWHPSEQAAAEAIGIYKAAVAAFPHLDERPAPAPSLDTSDEQRREPFPDGLDSFGNPVDPQMQMPIDGGARANVPEAMMR